MCRPITCLHYTNHKELKGGAYSGQLCRSVAIVYFVRNIRPYLCPLSKSILKNLPKKRRPCTKQNEVETQIAVQGQDFATAPHNRPQLNDSAKLLNFANISNIFDIFGNYFLFSPCAAKKRVYLCGF